MKAHPSGKILSVDQLGRAARAEGKVNWYLTKMFFYLGASKGSNWSTYLWTQNLSSRWLSEYHPMHRRIFSTWFGRKEVSSWPQVDKVIISHIFRHIFQRIRGKSEFVNCAFIQPLDYEEVSPKNVLCDNSSKYASTQTFAYLWRTSRHSASCT